MEAISSALRAARWILPALLLCAGDPAWAEPGEVGNLLIGADKETISWDAEPQAERYHLYRGYVRELSPVFYGTTLEGDITNTSFVDPVPPQSGRGFFYLVTAADADGEGTMGDASSTIERFNRYPWPGVEVAGYWDAPFAWPGVAIHLVQLHTGKVLSWTGQMLPVATPLWDPVSETFSTPSVTDVDIFCAGHSFLDDGRVFVTGGFIAPLPNGPAATRIFDPVSETWSDGPDMNAGRYYPSNVTLGDGRVAIFSGTDEMGQANPEVEIYDPVTNSLQLLGPTANNSTVIYPGMHLMPDGQVFHSGPEPVTELFDEVTETWSYVATSNFGIRGTGAGMYGTVMVPPDPDRIMILGGSSTFDGPTTTETCEIIDLSDPTPAWQYTDSMAFARKHHNTTILPTGELMVAGGGTLEAIPVFPAEMFDPVSETWSTLGAIKGIFRIYHSTAVLLPDGRVLLAGGTTPRFNSTAAIYSPPYMFQGPRPVIDAAPAATTYGSAFSVTTADAAHISQVVLIRPSAATHAKNMSQRYIPLTFAPGVGSLIVSAPVNPNVAPPGYYMLWILDGDGVPSEAKFIRITS